jgi:hypothetical protein
MNWLSLRLGFLVFLVVLACFALSPSAPAVTPARDGGYFGGSTAEDTDALFSLPTGLDNTAIGFQALYSSKSGAANSPQ